MFDTRWICTGNMLSPTFLFVRPSIAIYECAAWISLFTVSSSFLLVPLLLLHWWVVTGWQSCNSFCFNDCLLWSNRQLPLLTDGEFLLHEVTYDNMSGASPLGHPLSGCKSLLVSPLCVASEWAGQIYLNWWIGGILFSVRTSSFLNSILGQLIEFENGDLVSNTQGYFCGLVAPSCVVLVLLDTAVSLNFGPG